MVRAIAFGILITAALPAAKKQPPAGSGESESVRVTAVLYTEKEAIKELIGDDLGGHYTVLSVKVESRFGRELDVKYDDFVLRTDKDGERSTPFAPSQIAGYGALVVTEGGTRRGNMMGDNTGPVWGGAPGTGGRPQRVGGDGGGVGSGTTEAVPGQTSVQSAEGQRVPPLQRTLEAKVLPEGKTEKALSGLLYFPLEKQKVKHLELIYKANDGKISLRFKD
jgi:hypothetical protein